MDCFAADRCLNLHVIDTLLVILPLFLGQALQHHGFHQSLLRLRLSKASTEITKDPATSSHAVSLVLGHGGLPVCSSTVSELRAKVKPADLVGVRLVCILFFPRPWLSAGPGTTIETLAVTLSQRPFFGPQDYQVEGLK